MTQKFFIKSDTLIQATEVYNTETGDMIDDATVTMSICNGTKRFLDIAYLEFRSGGVQEVFEDDTIVGQSSDASAVVSTIILEAGTWAGSDARGKLGVLKQYGTFTVGEALKVLQSLNVATVVAVSIGSVDAGGGEVWLPITNHGLKITPDADWIIIDGSQYFDGTHVIQAVEKDKIKITAAFKAEMFKGTEDVYIGLPNGKDIALTHDAVGPPPDAAGYYDGVLPDDITGMEEDESYYLFVTFVKGGITVTSRVYWKATFHPDEL